MKPLYLFLGIAGLFGMRGSAAAAGRSLTRPDHRRTRSIRSERKTSFPLSSGEPALGAELGKERLVIVRDAESPFSFTARYSACELVCRADWTIRWSSFTGKISSINADYGKVCR